MKLLNKMGVDIDIGVTLLYRVWTILAGAILLFIIPTYLSPDEQGYYFTISSLIALQVFFELGFNFVITQTISHEMAGLKVCNNLTLDGNFKSLYKVSSLIDAIPKWYMNISSIFFIVVFSLGLIFFWDGALDIYKWLPVWGLVTCFTAVCLFLSPYLSVMEGFGYVARVAKIRLIQSVVGYTLFIFALFFNSGLYALPLVSGIAALISTFWVIRTFSSLSYPEAFYTYRCDHKFISDKVSWWRDIRPLQSKLAISWFSGYLIFQLFNPFLFKNQGADVAGKVGLALTIYSTMLSISMSWVNAKIPTMSRLIAQKDFPTVNKIFRALVFRSSLVNLIVVMLFDFCVILLGAHEIPLVQRLPSLDIIAMLSFVTIINHLIFCMALYMRAFKEEPLVNCSLISGIITSSLVFIGSLYSDSMTIFYYCIVTTFISFPWVLFTFIRYRQGVALK